MFCPNILDGPGLFVAARENWQMRREAGRVAALRSEGRADSDGGPELHAGCHGFFTES